MTSGKLNDKAARCPFFIEHGKGWIRCESPLAGTNSTCKISFEVEKRKIIQYENYCCGNFDRCEMYRKIFDKYESEE